MIKYYYGARRQGPYFEGWYLKYQTRSTNALALIPALHIDSTGQRTASLQVIAGNGTWWLEYPEEDFCASEGRFQICMGKNRFHDEGAQLCVERNGLSLHGAIHHGRFAPLKSDIMGPFLSQRLSLDAMCLAGAAAWKLDALHCHHSSGGGKFHRLHLRGALSWPGIPPGDLPGRSNQVLVQQRRNDLSREIPFGGRRAGGAGTPAESACGGGHGPYDPRKPLCQIALPLLDWREPSV